MMISEAELIRFPGADEPFDRVALPDVLDQHPVAQLRHLLIARETQGDELVERKLRDTRPEVVREDPLLSHLHLQTEQTVEHPERPYP